MDKEPDKGVSLLTEFCDLMKLKPKVKVDTGLLSLRKDFKISGSIGESSNCTGYMSFLRQVESGTAKGHTERDIIDAINKGDSSRFKIKRVLRR